MSLGASIIQQTQEQTTKTSVRIEREHVVCIDVDMCVVWLFFLLSQWKAWCIWCIIYLNCICTLKEKTVFCCWISVRLHSVFYFLPAQTFQVHQFKLLEFISKIRYLFLWLNLYCWLKSQDIAFSNFQILLLFIVITWNILITNTI